MAKLHSDVERERSAKLMQRSGAQSGDPAESALATAAEPFIDGNGAAKFLSVKRRQLLQMARTGQIPAHTLGDCKRRQWRFRLSELSDAMTNGKTVTPANGNKKTGARNLN